MSKKVNFNKSIIDLFIMLFVVFIYYRISNYIAATLFIFYSFFSAVYYKGKYETFINCKTIFSFIFYFTIGLAMLRLHQDQVEWKFMTFILLFLSYFSFLFGYDTTKNSFKNNENVNKISKRKLQFMMNSILVISITALGIEFCIRGYLPIFSSDMSSYQNFGVTGIHYFTVSGIIYLPMMVYMFKNYNLSKKEKLTNIIKCLVPIMIPIVIVSRQLLLMEIILSGFILLKDMKKISKKNLFVLIFCIVFLILSWLFVGKFRNQNQNYLKYVLHIQEDSILSVQEMNAYMYIAFNYDNFNANVDNIEHYSYGYNSLFPVFALTGTKFIIGKYFVTDYTRVINVFTTYPIQMTPYSDFGVIGVIIYMIVIGKLCNLIEKKNDDAVSIIYKCLIWYCLLFSFFESFFSYPTIIFMFIYVYILSKIRIRGDIREKSECINVNI